MRETTKGKAARRARRSRAEWRGEIARWEQSGLSAREYAERHDLSASSLFWWSRHFRLEVGGSGAPERVSFVPLRVAAAATEKGSVPFEFEVTLANGRKVRARGDVDAGRFARMLDAVERGAR